MKALQYETNHQFRQVAIRSNLHFYRDRERFEQAQGRRKVRPDHLRSFVRDMMSQEVASAMEESRRTIAELNFKKLNDLVTTRSSI